MLIEDNTFIDLYFDVSKISGWYVPEQDPSLTDLGINTVNILFDGDAMTIRADKHILDYLWDTFAEKANKL